MAGDLLQRIQNLVPPHITGMKDQVRAFQNLQGFGTHFAMGDLFYRLDQRLLEFPLRALGVIHQLEAVRNASAVSFKMEAAIQLITSTELMVTVVVEVPLAGL
ncbi:hypothetical protein [Marinobacter azerbaijanicus]|uniref:hypothetical protein n=1 Tax=Marinobacter azerbaijanicus TaxID=3050455 RepID=UPI003BF5D87A